MKRRNLYYAIGTLLLTVYVCVAVAVTRAAAKADTFGALKIEVNDSANSRFITPEDIDIMLDDLSTRITKTRMADLNTLHLENRLRAHDNIEDAHVVILGDGTLWVNVLPMQPVARVFVGDSSYYISAAGKRISANARCHVDVPVVSGTIHSTADVAKLLPMFGFLKSRPDYNAYVSQVELAQNGDILIIPTVAGHLVNLGDTSIIADKMHRLENFYKQIMPLRGWEYYDAISLKWRGRVVASRAAKRERASRPVTEPDSITSDMPGDGTISPTGIPVVAPD